MSKKFDILLREVLFQGFFRIERLHVQHERFDGGQSPVYTRELFDRCRAVGVLLFDPQNDKVVLVEQFRIGPASLGADPWTKEIVMGLVDAAETPEGTAYREALEETGCRVLDLMPIANYFPSSGASSEYMYLFAGRINAPAKEGVFGVENEHEDIRILVLDAPKAISMLYAGAFCDAHTLLAMNWFATHHTDLRSKWLVSDVGTPII